MNVPQSKRMKPKTVEKLIQEASDDDHLRWKRAGVGGGIADAVISNAYRFRNDGQSCQFALAVAKVNPMSSSLR